MTVNMSIQHFCSGFAASSSLYLLNPVGKEGTVAHHKLLIHEWSESEKMGEACL